MPVPHFKYEDLRKKLKRAPWNIGTRKNTRFFTIHYNGPPVAGFGNRSAEIAQLQRDAAWHTRPGAFSVANGADGIQYHGATLHDGTNVQLRDWNASLWHAGNYTANTQSLSWHLPLGGAQEPTSAQLHSLFHVVIPAFQKMYTIERINIKGHKEWRNTECPGTIFKYLLDWRELSYGGLYYFKTLKNVKVRETPEVLADDSNVALKGTAIISVGTIFAVDVIVKGKPHLGIDTYVHRADGLGFMLNHPELLQITI